MKKTALFLVFIFACYVSVAQQLGGGKRNGVFSCSSFHVSKPLRDLFERNGVKEVFDENDLKESGDKENRISRKFKFKAEDGEEYREAMNVRQTTMGSRLPPPILANWAGQNGNSYPPDPTGAAGPNHYVQMVNATTIEIYNKTNGAQIGAVTNLGNLWSPAVGNLGDPIVMYDKRADRWFLSQFGNGGIPKTYIAISTSGDPTGTYYTYTFNLDFPDYQKYSIWENGYYLTANFGVQAVYCFERDQMIAGNPSARVVSDTLDVGTTGSFYAPLTADFDGAIPAAGAPCPIFSYYDNGWGGGGSDKINIWSMTVDWSVPSAVITEIPDSVLTSPFDASFDFAWNDIPQPGTTSKLEGIGGILNYRAQWRKWTGYNSVVLNFAVKINANQRSIRWCELRQNDTTGVWSLYQEGTYAPADGASRWAGSIAMDNNGSIALCYAKSDAVSVYPSLAYTGRAPTDTLGKMTFVETVAFAGSTIQTASLRFGDYSHTSIDPVDGITFWHTGEYLANGFPRTRIYSFQLPLPVGIAENANTLAVVSAFQSGNVINVIGTNLPTEDELVVDLFDINGKHISGKKIFPTANKSFETTIDVATISQGTYLVRVGKSYSSFQKVVKLIIR